MTSLAVLATACGSEVSSPESEDVASIAEQSYHLGEDGGSDPTINLHFASKGTFFWETDPGPIGDWIPSGNGSWSQEGAVVTLFPTAADKSMAFPFTLRGALSPASAVEAKLRVQSVSLVTVSVAQQNGDVWSPRSGEDERPFTWERGTACTPYGRSSGCDR